MFRNTHFLDTYKWIEIDASQGILAIVRLSVHVRLLQQWRDCVICELHLESL